MQLTSVGGDVTYAVVPARAAVHAGSAASDGTVSSTE
jgi:hypothetical protein